MMINLNVVANIPKKVMQKINRTRNTRAIEQVRLYRNHPTFRKPSFHAAACQDAPVSICLTNFT